MTKESKSIVEECENEFNEIVQLVHNNDELICLINKLKLKIRKIEIKNKKEFLKGKELYENAMDKNELNDWTETDFKIFINYFAIINEDKIKYVKNNYDKLTTMEICFVLMSIDGMDKYEIMKTMSMSNSAYRTMKSRIKNKKK